MPTAEMRMSDFLAQAAVSRVNLWATSTVQPTRSSSKAMGRPTWLEAPITVALAPK